MDDTQKQIEELKNEVTSLKVRLRRVEGFVEAMPNSDDYVSQDGTGNSEDPLIDEAIKIVCQYDRASASLLQRKLSTGYARAARLMDTLGKLGVIGSGKGSEPRDVLVRNAQEYFSSRNKS